MENVKSFVDRIKELEAEKAELEKLLKAHGIHSRRADFDKKKTSKLFGYKVVDNKVKRTTSQYDIRCNTNTFVDNVLRAVFPYPRGSKTGRWLSRKPYSLMSDEEYNISLDVLNKVIDICYEAKVELEKGGDNK